MEAGKYVLRAPESSSDWAAYHRIRRAALFEPYHPMVQYDPEHPDEHRAGHYPLVLIKGATVIGTIRVDLLDAKRAAFRIIAIDSGVQGRGHGTVLLRMAEDFVRGLGRRRVVLHGNPASTDFYLRNGYVKARWEDDVSLGDSVDVAKDL